ncbi:hypothetical protein TVAG_184610 [Trichomonas vaginalis G3]|uniref:Uncharacterized protein n=1 Tax=Trichomonas vaginalis (strain ATCC PRA-98 / G3) TaxID=412133 RepID=A2E9Z7_TRIV3|nr:hypothetical protein TVAGG3_0180900 [Trichomonas vaginalis G3]EAY10559.1 hypothetical protein TVAG_184610 [Trichomonas vaginalis G3]KAI5549278.1 hypothetical protein TVAGG3_0180900 [Trichomonas vaginalis G3]|eukprot:XP_001322782.1 hypothetical protein [Trichomonas vaginalis G3]
MQAGHMLMSCIIELTRNDIATCYFGAFNKKKAEEFFENKDNAIIGVAFGNEGEDRWIESVVKWMGSWRGSNQFQDKFYDMKVNDTIKFEAVGDRKTICTGMNKIPCVMKPHSYRIIFDEPNIHIYCADFGTGMYSNSGTFDIGNIMATIQAYYEAKGNKIVFEERSIYPACPFKGGEYVITAQIL